MSNRHGCHVVATPAGSPQPTNNNHDTARRHSRSTFVNHSPSSEQHHPTTAAADGPRK